MTRNLPETPPRRLPRPFIAETGRRSARFGSGPERRPRPQAVAASGRTRSVSVMKDRRKTGIRTGARQPPAWMRDAKRMGEALAAEARDGRP